MKISYHESFRKHFRRAYCVLGMDYKLVIQRWKRPRFRLVAPLEFLSRSLRITIREQRDLSRICVYMSGKVFVFVFYFFFNLDYMLLFKGFWRYLHSSHKTEKISVIFISKKRVRGKLLMEIMKKLKLFIPYQMIPPLFLHSRTLILTGVSEA